LAISNNLFLTVYSVKYFNKSCGVRETWLNDECAFD